MTHTPTGDTMNRTCTIDLDTRESFRTTKLRDAVGKDGYADYMTFAAQGYTGVVMSPAIGHDHALRLMHVVRVLDGALPGAFDLSTYVHDAPLCGTTACACGWASLDPWFQVHTPSLVRCSGFAGMASWISGTAAAQSLFTPRAYPAGNRTKPARVADRIRVLLAAAGYAGKYTLDLNSMRFEYNQSEGQA